MLPMQRAYIQSLLMELDPYATNKGSHVTIKRSPMLQWRSKILWPISKTCCSQINSLLFLFSRQVVVQLFVTPRMAAHQAPQSFTISRNLLRFMSVELVMLPISPLSPPSPLALNLSQDQGLFKWVSSLHQVNKVLAFQLQHQSFQWTPRTDLL